jgi:hypothetical protein
MMNLQQKIDMFKPIIKQAIFEGTDRAISPKDIMGIIVLICSEVLVKMYGKPCLIDLYDAILADIAENEIMLKKQQN